VLPTKENHKKNNFPFSAQAASAATVGGVGGGAPSTPVTAGSLGPASATVAGRPASGPRLVAIKTGGLDGGKFALSLSPVATPTAPTITPATATATKTITPSEGYFAVAPQSDDAPALKANAPTLTAGKARGFQQVYSAVAKYAVSSPTPIYSSAPTPIYSSSPETYASLPIAQRSSETSLASSTKQSTPPVSLYTRGSARSSRMAPATLHSCSLGAETRVDASSAVPHIAMCARDGIAWTATHRAPSSARPADKTTQRTMSLVGSPRYDAPADAAGLDASGRSLSFTSSPATSYRSPTNFHIASGAEYNCGATTPRVAPPMAMLPLQDRALLVKRQSGHSLEQQQQQSQQQQQPQYRVLHSYNSPAYRNAPVWG
jgi:hypothetical protein